MNSWNRFYLKVMCWFLPRFYSDRRYNWGEHYAELGMVKLKEEAIPLEADFHWVKSMRRESRHDADEKLALEYGWDRIYGAGVDTWVWPQTRKR